MIQLIPMLAPFLGPIISRAADKIITDLIKSPQIPVSPQDRHEIKPEVEKAVAATVGPIIQDLTNTEPWYKSNVTLGAIASMLSGVLALLGYSIGAEELLPVLIGIGFIVGPIWTLYGRWAGRNAALKRLGVK